LLFRANVDTEEITNGKVNTCL